jgi:hypothetical protein
MMPPPPRVGPMGSLARVSPRAHIGDAGGWLCDAAAHGAEASALHTILPAPDVTVVRPERGLGRGGAPPAHFDKAQAEQALWQEFQDHYASINNALNVRCGSTGVPCGGFSRCMFFVRSEACSLTPFVFACFLTSLSPVSCLLVTGAGGPRSGEVRPPRSIEQRARLVSGPV